jgi:hypothetical protein
MNDQFEAWHKKWAEEMLKRYVEPYGYDRIRVVPKSKWRQFKQWVGLEPKKYRNKAKKGYVMTKDLMGYPIQVKKSEYVKPTKGQKTITFERDTEL